MIILIIMILILSQKFFNFRKDGWQRLTNSRRIRFSKPHLNIHLDSLSFNWRRYEHRFGNVSNYQIILNIGKLAFLRFKIQADLELAFILIKLWKRLKMSLFSSNLLLILQMKKCFNLFFWYLQMVKKLLNM